VYISELRKFLHRPGQAGNPVVTIAPGYLLRKGTDEIDFHQFLQLMSQGRAHMKENRHEAAADRFEEAVGLWRGCPLDDLRSGTIIDSCVTWLSESRLECLEMLGDAQLLLGRHREIVAHLYSLTAENPFHEAFYRQLMLALYRSQRQADALKVYRAARKTLHEELGLEPCRALRELQRAILADDGALDLAAVS
jgi:DNA-binding SARP family transcriptional activator